jgi:CDP-alcohol phosphatidyltransferase
MSFWSGYRASIKPLEVEEPIDVYLHRPLAYILARICLPLPISPNAITLMSIVAGLLAAASLVFDFPHHFLTSGALLFSSAVLDCADGQLARMRRTSSVFGRMLDGMADLVTMVAVAPASAFVIWRTFATPWWAGAAAVALATLTMVTTSFHTTMYDHYKNVFLRLTGPFQEGEDYEAACDRYEAQKGSMGILSKITFPVYLFYLKSQRDYVMKFDPFTSARLTLYPAYDAVRAAMYREVAGPAMAAWKAVFGFGSMIFGLALFNGIGHPELYLLIRLVVLNLLFFGYMRPLQRRASREAFRRMGIVLPDQKGAAVAAVA